MHSYILRTIALSLGLAACGDDKDLTSTSLETTGTTTAGSTSDTSAADEPTTGSSTTEPGGTMPEPGGTTTDPGGTMPEPGNTTTDPGGTMPEPDSTTIVPDSTSTTIVPDSTTIEPDTTTDGGTDVPYVDCSNDPMNPVPCPAESECIDGFNTNGGVFGSFCSPLCSDPDMLCPIPDGAVGLSAVCLFGKGVPTHCALACDLADDTCPAGLTCEDTGFSHGVCTHP